MPTEAFTQQHRRSEQELADLLEDETLRMLDNMYHDSLDMDDYFRIQAQAIYTLILKSVTAFDAMILLSRDDDGDIIGEEARDWLLDFALGNPDYGDYFIERVISRIQLQDYQLKEG
ncbi:MAG: hypothetical protein E6Q68_07605 [Polynucleobacter sp.]|nr:MAG: hypothetical protein E6Q68_07605 [Polynucleobacter sp.]